ncbi:(2Fe-2S) ferredoxin domain-containing protein [Ampullimonas aquatilis]|uniref:(2Fe-2S) ferredoxin domain-containing protein n=1 Tax=Ampullimonas aquatilis TaxID=1341549 RepID=UPI003C77DF08
MSQDSYFKHHVFFCLNQRSEGEACCANLGAKEAFDHMKKAVKNKGLSGAGQIRVNKAGCLDRCELGPVMVVYPEGTWYTYVDNSDIDEILESHLIQGKPVERLKV